jgi:hypothetical protein
MKRDWTIRDGWVRLFVLTRNAGEVVTANDLTVGRFQ